MSREQGASGMRSRTSATQYLLALLLVLAPVAYLVGRPLIGSSVVQPREVVALTLSVAGRSASVKVPSGACASVTTDSGEQMRLLAEVTDNGVDLLTWTETGGAGECNAKRAIGKQRLALNAPSDIQVGNATVRIEWTGTTIAPGGSAGIGPCLECCVWCQGYQFCACAVVTECGRCCYPEACGCKPAVASAHN